MKILVTGARGMIGSQLVKGLLDSGYSVVGIDRSGEDIQDGDLRLYKAELEDKERLKSIAEENGVDRIIHLAALAHTEGEPDLSWEKYRRVNVDCAENVFDIAGERPVLFISTIDVYGFFDGKESINSDSPTDPVSNYGRSKALAEEKCKKLPCYTIFRLSPVYTDDIKRDIQKRYYLKYPKIAYRIGKGSYYEILNIRKAVQAMVDWCEEEPKNDIRIIKDEKPMWTPDYIKAERAAGRAKVVLRFPRWMILAGYKTLKGITGG